MLLRSRTAEPARGRRSRQERESLSAARLGGPRLEFENQTSSSSSLPDIHPVLLRRHAVVESVCALRVDLRKIGSSGGAGANAGANWTPQTGPLAGTAGFAESRVAFRRADRSDWSTQQPPNNWAMTFRHQ